jgi:hypothetical protein
MTRIGRALFVSLALAAGTGSADAAETLAFDPAAFAAAQQADRPIIVAIKAWWCPVCVSQGRTIRDEVKDPAYADLVVFQLDYDKQKVELSRFQVNRQGTLIAYRGTQQIGRLDFVTDKPRIRALVAQTVR